MVEKSLCRGLRRNLTKRKIAQRIRYVRDHWDRNLEWFLYSKKLAGLCRKKHPQDCGHPGCFVCGRDEYASRKHRLRELQRKVGCDEQTL